LLRGLSTEADPLSLTYRANWQGGTRPPFTLPAALAVSSR